MSILNLFSDKIVTFFYNINKSFFFNTTLQDYFLIIFLDPIKINYEKKRYI
jgi:hypothetical protein